MRHRKRVTISTVTCSNMAESATLRKVQAAYILRDMNLRMAGYGGSGEDPSIRVYGPNEEFPLPWHMIKDIDGICDLYSGNKHIVGWLTETDARRILVEVGL